MSNIEKLVHDAKVFDRKATAEKNPGKRIGFYDSEARVLEKLRVDAEKNGQTRKEKDYTRRIKNAVDSANELRDYLHKSESTEYDTRTPDYGGIPMTAILALGFFVFALGFSSFSITGFASIDDGQLSTVSYIAISCFVVGIVFAIIYLKKVKKKKKEARKLARKKKSAAKKPTRKKTTKKKKK